MRTATENKITADTYLTTHQAAGFIQVNPSSINKWVEQGLIKAFRTPGGHRRVKASDFVAFLERHAMPVPDVLRDGYAPSPRYKPGDMVYVAGSKTAKKSAKKR